LIRFGVVMYLCLSVGCILLTGSRSSLLGLMLWGAIAIWRSPWRWRGMILGLICCPLLFVALPDELQTRFETIVNPDAGPANAKVSGEGRIEGLTKGMELWVENPATGVGPGVWRPATGSKLESHNLYGQLMGELGSLGIIAFGAILICYWMNLRWVRQHRLRHPEQSDSFIYHLAGAVGMGIFLMLFEGNFGHNLFRHNWLWYGGFLIIGRHCLEVQPVPVTYLYSTRVSYTTAYAR
jgi:O-antigen ligase